MSCVLVSACSSPETNAPTGGDTSQAANALPSVDEAELADNPFRQDWQTPFGVPPFAEIEDDDYMPAISKAIEELRSEISAITAITSEPTFENTILALELAGSPLDKVAYTFNNVTNTDSNDMLRELETQIFPLLTREFDAIVLNEVLYERVKTVYDARDELDLDEQQARLLELTHRRFVRAGAIFAPEVKERVAEINAEISGLNTQFAQNLLLETKGFTLELKEEDEVAGLSDDFKSAIYDADKKAWVVGLNRSAYESFMVQSTNRELRERLFNGYRLRASKGEYDNGPIAVKIAQLRAERAALMGYDSHAHYILEYNMAKTPQGAEDFLLRVWRPALAQAKQERADMQGMMGDTKFEAWDWWHQAEKLRLQRYALDENATKPYFKLENVQAGAHAMAGKLFGLSFEQVPVEGWNPLVVSFDVKDEAGEHLGLFMTDMFARDSKRGGAWMSSYRGTSNINGDRIRPLITNNMNLPQPPEGEPALMRYSDVETLFHEFGHALHGLMTQIDYPTFSGVDGPRDYTEFPAQILEHWVSQPEMLAMYAKHYQTGEVIPIELVEKIRAAANHNQGFYTTEYVAASLLDLAWHSLGVEEAQQITDARAFEREVLESYGLIDEIEPRYRSQYFSHIFAGGYSAGYYAYLWSEILDADGFAAFKQAEDIWDPELAGRLKRWVYEAGGLRPADELYRNFRGQDPSIEPLLEGRGFIDTPSPDA
ncbi:MAG: M3 family peptidase [Gammaproteobacteria bacterium TMED57]|jgi:peptidyl-dipeptidase Dcp|nr:MAG: M3 family peptidase [Gammaproteobacteria bacterium TMED57]